MGRKCSSIMKTAQEIIAIVYHSGICCISNASMRTVPRGMIWHVELTSGKIADLHGREHVQRVWGSRFCSHGRRKGECKGRGGFGICPHGRIKSECKECSGSGMPQCARQAEGH